MGLVGGRGGFDALFAARCSRVEVVKTSNRCSGWEDKRCEWLMGGLRECLLHGGFSG